MSEVTSTPDPIPSDSPGRPPKRIVLCSDGTGNKGGTGRDTNVWRLFTYLDLNSTDPQQVAFYDDGIGTQDFKLLKALGGAFGYGLSRNIRQLYEALVRNYQPGDKIYIFGFSRGAYTARVLAALICKCGVVKVEPGMSDQELGKLTREAMRHMRDSYDLPILTGWLRIIYSKLRNRHADADAFRGAATHDNGYDPDGTGKLVHFLGVWDTVSAIGTPLFGLTTLINTFFYRIDFPDLAVHHRVNKARQALAIDDERATFHPMLWDESLTETNMNELNRTRDKADHISSPDIQQIWFPGVHSNVGGGYPKQGLAYASLVWMMKVSGLKYRQGVSAEAESLINPTDKLYDSRSGAAAYYRYRPRDIAAYAADNTNGKTQIDTTVIERIFRSVDAYAPGNVPFDAEVVDASGVRAALVDQPMAAVLEVKAESSVAENSMLHRQAAYISARQVLHALLITTTFVVAAILYLPEETGTLLERMGTAKSEPAEAAGGWLSTGLAVLLPEAMSKHFHTLRTFFNTYPAVFWGILVWLGFLYGLRFWLNQKTNAVYRKFWGLVRDKWLKNPSN